jgi:hypothetical protein
MKMFDFVYLRIRHVHMIDISLTPEQKVALKQCIQKPVMEGSVTVLKGCCCLVKVVRR